MLESTFQSALIRDLKRIFEGCIVLKNDPTYIQGFPDLLILFEDKWAALECKPSAKSSFRPNQEYYLRVLNSMCYASVIYPENKEEVISELQQAFFPSRYPRFSRG